LIGLMSSDALVLHNYRFKVVQFRITLPISRMIRAILATLI
jgi:hypothetical protein